MYLTLIMNILKVIFAVGHVYMKVSKLLYRHCIQIEFLCLMVILTYRNIKDLESEVMETCKELASS